MDTLILRKFIIKIVEIILYIINLKLISYFNTIITVTTTTIVSLIIIIQFYSTITLIIKFALSK